MIKIDSVIGLSDAQAAKILELKADRDTFFAAGHIYNGDTFKINGATTINIDMKDGMPLSAPDRFIFSDILHKPVDFIDEAGFHAFREVMDEESDRVWRKYNNYREQIASCTLAQQVRDIIISF